MLSLDDTELQILMRAAVPILPQYRDQFLRALANERKPRPGPLLISARMLHSGGWEDCGPICCCPGAFVRAASVIEDCQLEH